MATDRNGPLIATLFLGVLMAALDIAVLGPAIPAIRTQFGVDDRTVAWVFNTFVFFNLMGVPLMAKGADLFGRRRVYLIDISLFAVGAALVAAAPTFEVLLVGRALQGAAASGIFPVAAAVVGDSFSPDRRGRALGVLGAVFGVAFIIGPILAGLLLLVDWRLIYVSFLPLALVVVVLARRHIPRSTGEVGRRLDLRGLFLLGIVLVSLAYGVNQLDTSDLVSSLVNPRVWMPLALVLLFLPVFIRNESRTEDPVVRPGLFRSRQVVIASVLAASAGLSESVFIFLPSLAKVAFGVSASTASFMLLPLVGSVAIASPVAGRVVDRLGSRTVILTCQVLLASGMALVSLWGTKLAFFYTGSVFIGVGLAGILGPSLSYILLHEARVHERTISQGLITLFISIGQLVGGAAIGAVAASYGPGILGYDRAFFWIAIVATLVLFSAFGLKSRAAEQAQADG